MKLPNGEFAIVSISKLRDYSLNLEHRVGKHKARVFLSALGVRAKDAEWLRSIILEKVISVDAKSGVATQFGDRYTVDFELSRFDRTATIRTSWIILKGELIPRLVTCYVR